MKKYRQYSRDITETEREKLRMKYEKHLKSAKNSILSSGQRKRLLGIKNKEHGTTDSDFWYKIDKSIQSGLVDLQLICDVATEDRLQKLFGEKPMASQDYPITAIMTSLLPKSDVKLSKKEKEKLQQEQKWRKHILNELVLKSLYWYFHSGLFKTDSHKRLLAETIDAVSVFSDGDHGIHTNYDVKLRSYVR